MTKKLRTELAHSIADLGRDVQILDERLDGIIARFQWMQLQTAERPTRTDVGFLETDQPIPPRPRWRLLNGSWPMRDGNTYPPVRGKGPIGGYESWVRRSPPATE